MLSLTFPSFCSAFLHHHLHPLWNLNLTIQTHKYLSLSLQKEKPISILTSKRERERESKFAKTHFYSPFVSCLSLSSFVKDHHYLKVQPLSFFMWTFVGFFFLGSINGIKFSWMGIWPLILSCWGGSRLCWQVRFHHLFPFSFGFYLKLGTLAWFLNVLD
jgi:hypothetical protein